MIWWLDYRLSLQLIEGVRRVHMFTLILRCLVDCALHICIEVIEQLLIIYKEDTYIEDDSLEVMGI